LQLKDCPHSAEKSPSRVAEIAREQLKGEAVAEPLTVEALLTRLHDLNEWIRVRRESSFWIFRRASWRVHSAARIPPVQKDRIK